MQREVKEETERGKPRDGEKESVRDKRNRDR